MGAATKVLPVTLLQLYCSKRHFRRPSAVSSLANIRGGRFKRRRVQPVMAFVEKYGANARTPRLKRS